MIVGVERSNVWLIPNTPPNLRFLDTYISACDIILKAKSRYLSPRQECGDPFLFSPQLLLRILAFSGCLETRGTCLYALHAQDAQQFLPCTSVSGLRTEEKETRISLEMTTIIHFVSMNAFFERSFFRMISPWKLVPFQNFCYGLF